jgi:P27 family predicted phage terminase small subunit
VSLIELAGGDGTPPEPDWSSLYTDELDVAAAREHWGVILREMQEAGTLAVANGDAVQRLVQMRIIFHRSSRDVAERGAVMKAKRSRVPQYNPEWTVMRQADERIMALEDKLGLAPSGRGKVTKVSRAKKAARAADAYLRRVAK